MTDRSAFTDDEWSALSEAPLWVTLAVVTVGEHGPISMVKEAAASARAIAQPPEQGPADQLIAQLGKDAESKEARHDVKDHAGKTPDEIVEAAIRGVDAAAAALAKVTPEEAAEIRAVAREHRPCGCRGGEDREARGAGGARPDQRRVRRLTPERMGRATR